MFDIRDAHTAQGIDDRRIEFRAFVSPEAVDSLMCKMTGMAEAGPYRPGRIRMRSWDFRLPDILPEGELPVEVGPGVGFQLPLDPKRDQREYSAIFVAPQLWRWHSRSGSSWMRIQEEYGEYSLEAVLTIDGAFEVVNALNKMRQSGTPVEGIDLLESLLLEFEVAEV